MQRYAKAGGDTGVRAFEIGEDHIIVQFNDGSKYTYSYKSTGEYDVEQMKMLAKRGSGLSTYISQNVRERYER